MVETKKASLLASSFWRQNLSRHRRAEYLVSVNHGSLLRVWGRRRIMPTHVPIVLRRRGKFRFPGESCAVHRTIGQVIADVDTQTAAQLICDDIADLFVGKLPSDATYLDRNHPQSPITSVPCVKGRIRTRSSAISFHNNRQSNNPTKEGNPTRADHPTRLRANQKNIRRTLLIAAAEHGKGA
jgi:hypothetical protein